MRLEQVGAESGFVNGAGARAFEGRDYDPLASGPDKPRWHNGAQWARNSMIHEGLLKGDSPRGVWEISDKGRAAPKDEK